VHLVENALRRRDPLTSETVRTLPLVVVSSSSLPSADVKKHSRSLSTLRPQTGSAPATGNHGESQHIAQE